MPAVLVAVLAVVAVFELAATFRVMWLAGHGRHRLRAARTRRIAAHLHPGPALF